MHRLMHGACIRLFLQDAFVCCATQSWRWIKTQHSSNISITGSEGRAEGYSLIFTVLSYLAPTVARLLQKSLAANKIHSLYVRGVLLKK